MIDALGHVFRCKSDSIFSNNCFTGRRMGSDENTISHFQPVNSFFLEVIKFERILDVCQIQDFGSKAAKCSHLLPFQIPVH